MLCAHTTHIDRLQPPDTAVILDLHTGKITNGIGYGMDAQPLQLRAVEHLRRDDFFGTAAAEDDHRINPLYLGEPGGTFCAETAVAPGPRQRAGHNTTVNTNLRIRFLPVSTVLFCHVKILHAEYFGRNLADPAALSVERHLYFNEIHILEIRILAVEGHSIRDFEVVVGRCLHCSCRRPSGGLSD